MARIARAIGLPGADAGAIGIVGVGIIGETSIAAGGFLQLRLDNETSHESSQSILKRLLDKFGHEHIALQLYVFSQVDTCDGSADSEFNRLHGLSRQTAADGPFLLDIEAHGCIAVRLHSVGEIVEAGLEGNLTRIEAGGEVVDLIGDRIPDTVIFLGRGFRWWLNLLARFM